MLFLNLHYYKDSYYSVPPEKIPEISAASYAFIDKYLKSGKCQDRYWFADGSGGIAIWDFESPEEANAILRESVVFPYLKSQLIPLIDYKGLTKMRAQAETAQKAASRASKK